jgi:glucan biosynthesis protein C
VHWWRRSARRHQLPGWNLPLWIAYVYNCASWLWSFAFIGLFLRYLQHPHRWLGYLADSSYWVYLLHMPLTIGFGALLYGAPLPALAKITLNVMATTAVCLASYHLSCASRPWVRC